MYEIKSHRATTKQSSYRNTVEPRLIGPIGTKDFLTLKHFLTFKERLNHIKNYHLGPQNVDLY